MVARIAFVMIAVAVAFPGVAGALEPEGGPLREPFAHNELYNTWRNLANEQVMFPLEMKNLPVRIGADRQLFLDNYLIAESNNVRRQVHEPARHSGNPLLTPRQAKLTQVVPEHVLQFDTSPRFRMWYWSCDSWHQRANGDMIRFATSYATSEDGICWKRPNLNLHKVQGVPGDNSVVLPYGMMQGLFHEPDEPDPDKRFKALICVEARKSRDGKLTPEFTIPEGYYLHTSPDGIHWKGDFSRYVIPSLSGYRIPQSGIGDTTRFWWDALRKKYVCDAKFVIPGKRRCTGIMESDDLIHWSRARPILFARRPDAQLYGHRGFVYQGMYVGMRWIYVPEHSRRHSSYVELDCSRDGHIWTRVGAGQPFMPFNPKHDTWDASIIRPISMLEVGDEIWIYYFAAPTEIEAANPKLPKSHLVDYSLGLATLKRDRFVSINGGGKTGTLVTRPLSFKGNKLHVNAEIANGGKLAVAVVNRDGKVIAGHDIQDCQALTGNGIDLPVAWKNKSKLSDLGTSPIRLRFELRNAKLYSFWIE